MENNSIKETSLEAIEQKIDFIMLQVQILIILVLILLLLIL